VRIRLGCRIRASVTGSYCRIGLGLHGLVLHFCLGLGLIGS
jgi:hypothetical protein